MFYIRPSSPGRHRLLACILIIATGLIVKSPAANLLAHYEFENNFNDSSGSANHAAAAGAHPGEVSFSAQGFRGAAADINDPAQNGGNNSGGQIDIPVNANPGVTPEISFGGWVNLQSNAGFPGFMASDEGGWDRGIHLNTNSWGIASGGNAAGIAAAPVNTWQYVVGTFGAGTATLYVGDDNPQTQTTTTGSRPDTAGGVSLNVIEIGRYDNQDLDALVDDIFVFDSVLSSHQVNAIRNLALSDLLYSPAQAAQVFDLFANNETGVVDDMTWSPVSGLDPVNPGSVSEAGGVTNLVLTDDGSGMAGTLGGAAEFRIIDIVYDTANATVTLTWKSRPGKTYAVRYTDSLNDDANGTDPRLWPDLDDSVASGGETTSFTDVAVPDYRFYVIEEQ